MIEQQSTACHNMVLQDRARQSLLGEGPQDMLGALLHKQRK